MLIGFLRKAVKVSGQLFGGLKLIFHNRHMDHLPTSPMNLRAAVSEMIIADQAAGSKLMHEKC